jgi:hypothetical protein
MKTKSNKNKVLYIFCMCFVFFMTMTITVSTIDMKYQVAFSQRFIPPPSISLSNNIQTQGIQQCVQVGIIGASYTSPDGCPKPCPTTGNIPAGCPVNPIGKGGIIIDSHNGQMQTNTPPRSSRPPGVESFAPCNLNSGDQDKTTK